MNKPTYLINCDEYTIINNIPNYNCNNGTYINALRTNRC